MNQVDPGALYCDLMEEVKRRFRVIKDLSEGSRTTSYQATNLDCSILQFRKILELVALGSLVANIEEYSRQFAKFAQHWHAARIFRDLETVNPNFYPEPIREVPHEDPNIRNGLVALESGFLTRSEFEAAYDKCSELLHARSPFSAREDYAEFESLLGGWMGKLRTLLNTHRVRLVGGRSFLLVHMLGAGDGRVKAWTFVAFDSPDPGASH